MGEDEFLEFQKYLIVGQCSGDRAQVCHTFPRDLRSSNKLEEHSFCHWRHSHGYYHLCDIEFHRPVIRVSGYLVRARYVSTYDTFQGLSRTRREPTTPLLTLSTIYPYPSFSPPDCRSSSEVALAREFGGCIECPTILRSRLWCPATLRSFHG